MKKRLDKYLSDSGKIKSRSLAQSLIMQGKIKVDDSVITKPGHQVTGEEKIDITEDMPYVSRGALKLESVAEKFNLDFNDKVILDVGSSTGGFTDFALQNGAKKAYAVDVGTNQLDYKLRMDDRVVVMEKTDIRSVESLEDDIDIVVIDVSFISLKLIMEKVAELAPQAQIVAMAKPQFESDKRTADLHKGIIKNDTIRRGILKELEQWFKDHGFFVAAKADSKIHGAKGNVERFYLLQSN